MAIPTGHIITVGSLHLVERLQDVGLRDPKIPVDTIRETGNDLVVGKVLTEANFQFSMTSWDVSTSVMAMLNGGIGGPEPAEDPSLKATPELWEADPAGTAYYWENCQFLNIAAPWAKDTGTAGGHITSGVLIPAYYPTAMSYKFGVTANAEQTVTLEGGAYYMSDAFPIEALEASCYPIEQFNKPAAKATTVETVEAAKVHRIGGAGGEEYRHVFGVLVNGIIQQEGVDYVEEGGAIPGKKATKVKLKFTKEFSGTDIVRFLYFSTTAHAIPQAKHAGTSVKPAAVRGRNIEIWIGTGEGGGGTKLEGAELLRGIQTLDINATHTGSVQREMGTYDPIGYNETGIDTNGTLQMDPKEEEALYKALEKVTGVSRSEVFGYINEHPIPMWVNVHNPKEPTKVIKSIRLGDCRFQTPGTAAKVNSTLTLPISFESEKGTFHEVKAPKSDTEN